MTNTNVGQKIKQLREAAGMTQKELSEKLGVTPQAVSRWETDAVEPDIQTLKEMALILDVSVNQIINFEEHEKPLKLEILTSHSVNVEPQPQQKLIGNCVKCGRVVYENNVGRTMGKPHSYGTGRTHHHVPARPELVCKECFEIEQKEEKALENERVRVAKQELNDRRGKAFGWSIAAVVAYLIFAIIYIVKTAAGVGSVFLQIGVHLGIMYVIFSLVFVLIINNTFINEMVAEVFSWGFVRMPGIIFELDLDGIVWLLTVKLLFWIIGLTIAAFAGAAAIALGALFSIFTFPFALRKSYGESQDTQTPEENPTYLE